MIRRRENPIILAAIQSVSYTHLDVYKRQALAFLIDGLSVDMNSLAVADRANFGTITPIAAWFKTLGGVAFGFMLPILAGYIAMAIGDRPALVLGFAGGMIASSGKSGFLGEMCIRDRLCHESGLYRI